MADTSHRNFQWLATTAYATTQYPKMLTYSKMCNSTQLVSSWLKVNDLGISTFLLYLLSIELFGALIQTTGFSAHVFLFTIFHRLNPQVILILLGHRLEQLDFFSQSTIGKMKIRLEKLAVNISDLRGGKNDKARRGALHEKLRLDLYFFYREQ